jgi:hypothetical protein
MPLIKINYGAQNIKIINDDIAVIEDSIVSIPDQPVANSTCEETSTLANQ